MDPIVAIRNVSKQFGAVFAVDDVSLEIARNDFFALLGPSGCGKTTLLRMVAGFEAPTGGSIVIDGQEMRNVPPNRRPVNMVFQSYAVFPHMTVGDNIAYGLKVTGTPKAEIAERVAAAIRLVRLEGLAERKPGQLSGGQRQRVALARALVKRPKVLLLDEPLSALDRKLREEMQFELVRLRHEVGITFVMVTHDQEEAMSMASRVAVMDHGRVVQTGAPVEIYENPASRFVAGFLGSVNLFEGVAKPSRPGLVAVSSPEAPGDLVAAGQAHAGPVWFAIRPEKIVITAGQERAEGSLRGEVLEVAYLGERSILHVRLATGKTVQVNSNNAARTGAEFRPGDRVTLSWPQNAAMLLTR